MKIELEPEEFKMVVEGVVQVNRDRSNQDGTYKAQLMQVFREFTSILASSKPDAPGGPTMPSF